MSARRYRDRPNRIIHTKFAKFFVPTAYITKANRKNGMVYEQDWVTKPNWYWQKSNGTRRILQEPAAHITFDEAEDFCKWQGRCLSTR